jgi:hypothetical protein
LGGHAIETIGWESRAELLIGLLLTAGMRIGEIIDFTEATNVELMDKSLLVFPNLNYWHI